MLSGDHLLAKERNSSKYDSFNKNDDTFELKI